MDATLIIQSLFIHTSQDNHQRATKFGMKVAHILISTQCKIVLCDISLNFHDLFYKISTKSGKEDSLLTVNLDEAYGW